MTPAASWNEQDYYRAVRNARAAWQATDQQLSFGVLESAGTWEAAPAGSSAPSDGNPRGHPPDDQRIPASSLSAWGRDNGALDLSAEEVAFLGRPDEHRAANSPHAAAESDASASAEHLTTSGPPAAPPKEDSGRAEGGHSNDPS